MRIFVGNRELDLTGRERIQIKYQAAPVAQLLAPKSAFSVEFEIPSTAYNLETFGYNDQITTTDTNIFNKYEARAEQRGVDLNIVSCEVTSFDPLRIRLYGSGASFFSLIKDNLLTDLALTDLDHTWNDTAITGLLILSDYSYPIINYGVLTEDSNAVPCEYCYPAIKVKRLIDSMVEDNGYTLVNELDTDSHYTNLIIPFSNKKILTMTDEEKQLVGFDVYSSGQTITKLVETDLTFANEVSDLGGDFASNRWTAPYDGYYSFYFKCSCRSAVALTTTQVTFALYRFDGVTDTLLNTYTTTVGATYEDVIPATFSASQHEIHAGDEVYITATPLDQNLNIQGGLDGSGDGYTRWNLDKIWDFMILGFTWRVAINLPKMQQSTLLEYITRSFCLIIGVNEITKTVTLTKFDTILKNKSQGKDWTDKIDLSVYPTKTFELPDLGVINWLKYLDDDNVVKPAGTDYKFSAGTRFSGEKDVYVAPFAASDSATKFPNAITVVDIEISGESEVKPRILLSRTRRFSEPLSFTVSGVEVDTDGILNIPYFADISSGYDLTWSKLAARNLANYLEIITNPRGVELRMKLTESDINQLDFTIPVYLGSAGKYVFNAWFYISEVNYDEFGSLVKLNLING